MFADKGNPYMRIPPTCNVHELAVLSLHPSELGEQKGNRKNLFCF